MVAENIRINVIHFICKSVIFVASKRFYYGIQAKKVSICSAECR